MLLANFEEMSSLFSAWSVMPPPGTPEVEIPTDPLILQFLQGASQFGRPLLAAANVEEMEELIAESAWDTAFLTFNNYLTQLMARAAPPEISAERLTVVVEKLSHGHASNCTPRLVELVLATSAAMAESRNIRRRGPRLPLCAAHTSEIIYDVAAPRFFVRAVVGAFSSSIAQMGLLAGRNATDLPAWKTTTLVGACCEGLTAYLQLLGLLGCTILADIPQVEGVTWDGLMDEWDQTRLRMLQAHEVASRQDELVFSFRGGADAAR